MSELVHLAARAWAFACANPLLVTLIVWPAITAAVNGFFADAQTYVETHPRFAIVKKIIQKTGFSIRGLGPLLLALINSIFVKHKAAADPDLAPPALAPLVSSTFILPQPRDTDPAPPPNHSEKDNT